MNRYFTVTAGFRTLPGILIPFIKRFCKSVIILSLLSVVSFTAVAQNGIYQPIPRMIPPSPESAALFRFNDFKVNHSTGIPEISIPLYTIECGPLTLPISIHYHAGGRKQHDVTGPIGIGWVLNAGGIISRTVFGYPDEQSRVASDIPDAYSLSNKNDYKYLAELFYQGGKDYNGAYKDSEYDIFSYSVAGLTGSFVLKDGSPHPLTLNGDKITGGPDRFVVTDPSGVTYSFGGSAATSLSTSYYLVNTETTWYLESITSADKKHTIKFTYEYMGGGKGIKYLTQGEHIVFNDNKSGPNAYNYPMQVVTKQNVADLKFGGKRITEIDFGTGKIKFTVDSESKVTKMVVTNANGTIVKTYEFKHSQLDITTEKNYKLDQLIETSGTAKCGIYKFSYFPVTSSNDYSRDYWGYRNSNTKGNSPQFQVTYQPAATGKLYTLGSSGVVRTSNEAKAKEGVLQKITYPTGNTTEFVYESNKYTMVNITKNGPGLRIKQIKTTDDQGQIIYKTYEYSNGTLMYDPDIKNTPLECYWLDLSGSITYPGNCDYKGCYRQRVYSSEIPPEVAYLALQPVFYSSVTEYNGTSTVNQGKTVYNYANAMQSSFLTPMPSPRYPSTYPAYYPSEMPKSFEKDLYYTSYKYIYEISSTWKKNNLISRAEYINENGVYKQLRTHSYSYTTRTEPSLRGLKIFKYLNFLNDRAGQRPDVEEFAARDFDLPVFIFTNKYLTRGVELLASESITEYKGNESMLIRKNYTYNDRNIVSKITTTTSANETLSEEIKYPFDPEYSAGAVHKKMVSLNMLNYPVSHIRKQGNALQNVTTEYTEVSAGQILPGKVSAHTGNGTPEVRLQFHTYDTYGNPVYITRDNQEKVVYIWGYKGLYPVAEIVNATYDEVRSALGVAPETLSTLSSYDSRINNLRNVLDKAHVTLYRYQPLVGVIEVIDPNGITTSYTYDAFKRLDSVFYHDKSNTKRTIESYNYNYRVKN